MLRLLLLMLIVSCAHVAATPPGPTPIEEAVTKAKEEIAAQAALEAEMESNRRALAKLLVDACTDEPTTDERIMATEWTLKHCTFSAVICIRIACSHLQACKPPHRQMTSL